MNDGKMWYLNNNISETQNWMLGLKLNDNWDSCLSATTFTTLLPEASDHMSLNSKEDRTFLL